MRAVYRLLGLVRRYGPGPVEAACARRWTSTSSRSARSPRCSNRPPRRTSRCCRPRPASPVGRFARDPAEYAPPRHPGSVQTHPASPAAPAARADRIDADSATPHDEHHDHPTPRAGPVDPVGADLIAHPEGPQARRAEGHPARAARAGPAAARWATPRSWSCSWPTRSSRRDSRSATLRAANAGLDPPMRLDTWNELDDLRYDRTLLSDLTSLRFTEAGHGVLILGPGRGRENPPGHRPRPRRDPPPPDACTSPAPTSCSPGSAPPASTTPSTPRCARLARVDLLILDDFALRPLDATETNDFYELVVERHRKAHDRHLEPGPRRVAGHDQRRPARPVRHRPAHLRRAHPRHRRPLLPATHPPARRR